MSWSDEDDKKLAEEIDALMGSSMTKLEEAAVNIYYAFAHTCEGNSRCEMFAMTCVAMYEVLREEYPELAHLVFERGFHQKCPL